MSSRPGTGGQFPRVAVFIVGTAAAAFASAIDLLARSLFGAVSLPELVEDAVVGLMPGPFFAFLLDRLGHLGKPLLFGGLLSAGLAAGGTLAVLLVRWFPGLADGVLDGRFPLRTSLPLAFTCGSPAASCSFQPRAPGRSARRAPAEPSGQA